MQRLATLFHNRAVRPARAELRIASRDFAALREHLLGDAAKEQMAVLFCRRHETKDGRMLLLVRDVVRVPVEALEQQSAAHISSTQEFARAVLRRARAEGLDIIDAHSHPFSSGAARFSHVDDANEDTLARYVGERMPGTLYGAMVFSQADVDARLWYGAASPPATIDRIVVGGSGLQVIRPASARQQRYPSERREGWEVFSRQVLAFGQEGQARLLDTAVAVVGAGGLGSAVVTLLTHLGFGELVIVDPDAVEASNLNRLLGASLDDAERGRGKVEALARYACQVRPRMKVDGLRMAVDAAEAWQRIADCDAMIVCVDNDGARVVANRLAVQHLVPMIDAATGIETGEGGEIKEVGGQVRCVLPGGACLQCIDGLDLAAATRDRAPAAMREAYRRRGYVVTEDVPAPSVVTLNATVAAEAVNELLALLTGVRSPCQYRLYDFRHARWTALSVVQRPDCVVCSRDAYFAAGDGDGPPSIPNLSELPSASRAR